MQLPACGDDKMVVISIYLLHSMEVVTGSMGVTGAAEEESATQPAHS